MELWRWKRMDRSVEDGQWTRIYCQNPLHRKSRAINRQECDTLFTTQTSHPSMCHVPLQLFIQRLTIPVPIKQDLFDPTITSCAHLLKNWVEKIFQIWTFWLLCKKTVQTLTPSIHTLAKHHSLFDGSCLELCKEWWTAFKGKRKGGSLQQN